MPPPSSVLGFRSLPRSCRKLNSFDSHTLGPLGDGIDTGMGVYAGKRQAVTEFI